MSDRDCRGLTMFSYMQMSTNKRTENEAHVICRLILLVSIKATLGDAAKLEHDCNRAYVMHRLIQSESDLRRLNRFQ